MRELAEVERIGAHFFGSRTPAGTVIGVESLARRDFYIEIEGITCERGDVRPAPADARVASWGRHVNATRGGDLVFVSGLMGYAASADRMIAAISDLDSPAAQRAGKAIGGLAVRSREQLAAAAQTQSIADQLDVVLRSLDSNLRSLIKLTVYVRDIADFPFVRAVLLATLGDDPPAITVTAVHDLPLRNARVQIEAVAV
jgi:enamine deaminase RidA (YjgF/YER057c/UK114 family)